MVESLQNAASTETNQEIAKVMSLTQAQRYLLCDLGYYNDVIRGYLILALQDAGFGREEIEKSLGCLSGVFDDCSAQEARQVYQKF